MAITRKVDTDVYCDICGKWVMGWTSNNDGVSRAWAAKYARKKGCTVGKKIICKECRIEKRIQTCSIQQKIGSAGRDSDGTCICVTFRSAGRSLQQQRGASPKFD